MCRHLYSRGSQRGSICSSKPRNSNAEYCYKHKNSRRYQRCTYKGCDRIIINTLCARHNPDRITKKKVVDTIDTAVQTDINHIESKDVYTQTNCNLIEKEEYIVLEKQLLVSETNNEKLSTESIQLKNDISNMKIENKKIHDLYSKNGEITKKLKDEAFALRKQIVDGSNKVQSFKNDLDKLSKLTKQIVDLDFKIFSKQAEAAEILASAVHNQPTIPTKIVTAMKKQKSIVIEISKMMNLRNTMTDQIKL